MKLTRKQRKKLYKTAISAVLFTAGIIVHLLRLPYVPLVLFTLSYLAAGANVLIKAVKGILAAQLLDENFLMATASLGAFVLGEYSEGAAVMLFYAVGELFESIAVDRSRRSIASLMDMRADEASVIRGGVASAVSPEEVAVGEVIVVKPYEKLPLDGVIIEGTGEVDTAALTGESLPRAVSVGDEVYSGSVNGDALLRVRVTKPFGESTVSRILDLVENSASKKSRHEAFITRFARCYTPIVVIAALLISVVPSLITGQWSKWVYQGLNFLVISCPCALVISVPLAFFGGIGAASKNGVLVKGGNYLEALREVDTVIFDKTGTLTEGRFTVTAVYPIGVTEAELMKLAAKAEAASSHPIARSIVEAYGKTPDNSDVTDITEAPGLGVTCKIGGVTVAVGGERMIASMGGHVQFGTDDGVTVMFVLRDGKPIGTISVSDTPRASAKNAIAALREAGIRRCIMLTGDREAAARSIANKLELDGYRAELMPDDKVSAVEEFLKNGKTAFVGDGINDAPVLSRADVGIAMGGIGSDAAIEAADVVLMDDDPAKIAYAVKIARRTVAIARENTVFALAVKGGILVMGLLGIANMWLAVFADVGVAMLAILNAVRVQR